MTSFVPRLKARLALPAHRKVSGLLEGEFASMQTGRGMEFNDLREYVRGDDVKDLDWKASARTGEMLVKRYVAVRRHTVLLVSRRAAAWPRPTRSTSASATSPSRWPGSWAGWASARATSWAWPTATLPGATASRRRPASCTWSGASARSTRHLSRGRVRGPRRAAAPRRPHRAATRDRAGRVADEEAPRRTWRGLRRLEAQHEVLVVRRGHRPGGRPDQRTCGAGRRGGAGPSAWLRGDPRLGEEFGRCGRKPAGLPPEHGGGGGGPRARGRVRDRAAAVFACSRGTGMPAGDELRPGRLPTSGAGSRWRRCFSWWRLLGVPWWARPRHRPAAERPAPLPDYASDTWPESSTRSSSGVSRAGSPRGRATSALSLTVRKFVTDAWGVPGAHHGPRRLRAGGPPPLAGVISLIYPPEFGPPRPAGRGHLRATSAGPGSWSRHGAEVALAGRRPRRAGGPRAGRRAAPGAAPRPRRRTSWRMQPGCAALPRYRTLLGPPAGVAGGPDRGHPPGPGRHDPALRTAHLSVQATEPEVRNQRHHPVPGRLGFDGRPQRRGGPAVPGDRLRAAW